jgi:hypothetical protein
VRGRLVVAVVATGSLDDVMNMAHLTAVGDEIECCASVVGSQVVRS